MNDNYNYPAGADNADAPWNQPPDPEPIVVNVEVFVTLRHESTVGTDNYTEGVDGSGCYNRELHDSSADIEKLYRNQHFMVPRLLEQLARYIEQDLKDPSIDRARRQQLKLMLLECQGWKVDDVYVDSYYHEY